MESYSSGMHCPGVDAYAVLYDLKKLFDPMSLSKQPPAESTRATAEEWDRLRRIYVRCRFFLLYHLKNVEFIYGMIVG